MENNNTTPVAEITEEKNKIDSLQQRLSKATAVKEPGAAKNIAQKNSSFWDASDEDFSIPVSEKTTKQPEKTEEKAAPKTEGNTSSKPEENKPAITDAMKRGSAITATGMVNISTRMLISPIHAYKVKKKLERQFTPHQLELLDTKLQEAEEKDLDAEEKRIKARYESIFQKYEKKMSRVEMTEPEKKEMQDAWYAYFDYTQSTLSPKAYVLMEVVNKVGARIVDAFTE